MPFIVANRVLETSTTTGTGSFTLLGASPGYQSFAVVGNQNTTYYTITDGTNWEVGIGTYSTTGPTLARTTVLSSSNSNSLVDWGAGTKEVFVAPPAYINEPVTSLPSEVGPDLIAWNNFSRFYTQNRALGPGQFPNAIGSVLPIQQVGIRANAYRGGVLTPSGDVHCAPDRAQLGLRILPNGVTRTYSLVYGLTTDSKYYGAVLDNEGFVHFIPNNAPVGQKVSPLGGAANDQPVVSTYSLAYTTTNAYNGGVLSTSGEIHFVPGAAKIGQKVATNGTVSTYALAYTGWTGTGYAGGILAPNGDIHFVPSNSGFGQKVSPDGVVSTYSLLVNGFLGAVIDPDGNVVFCPKAQALRGMRISKYGVVSTFQLDGTDNNFSYNSGVMSSDGQLYMMPTTTAQKVFRTNGTITTFQCAAISATTACFGGVISPGGVIVGIPYHTGTYTTTTLTDFFVQQVPQMNFGMGALLHPFLNKGI